MTQGLGISGGIIAAAGSSRGMGGYIYLRQVRISLPGALLQNANNLWRLLMTDQG